MSYEKQTWANGDVITANKLNHMEDGIAGGSYDLEFTGVGDSVESMEFSLKGMSFEELWEKAVTNHEIPTYRQTMYSDDHADIHVCTTNVSAYEETTKEGSIKRIDIYWLSDDEGKASMSLAGNELQFYSAYTEFTAIYDSTTREYTLTRDSNQ